MAEITLLRPEQPMVLFAKDDSDVGFYAVPCTQKTLQQSVLAATFGPLHSQFPAYSDEMVQEVAAYVVDLSAQGGLNFEDGWLALRIGVAAVLEFLMEKLKEARAGEKFEDKLRYQEVLRADAAELRYTALRNVLRLALGDQITTVLEATQ